MTENIIENFYLSPLLREIKPEFLQALAKIAVKKNNKYLIRYSIRYFWQKSCLNKK